MLVVPVGKVPRLRKQLRGRGVTSTDWLRLSQPESLHTSKSMRLVPGVFQRVEKLRVVPEDGDPPMASQSYSVGAPPLSLGRQETVSPSNTLVGEQPILSITEAGSGSSTRTVKTATPHPCWSYPWMLLG